MKRQPGLCGAVTVVLVFSGMGVARAQVPPSNYSHPEADQGHAPPSAPTKLPKFSVPIRPAIALQGAGKVDDSCDGECAAIPSGATDFDNRVAFGLGVDFMGSVGKMVRLGLGFFYIAPYEVDLDTVDEGYEFGSDLSMDFVFELTPRVAPGVWLVPRVQGGLTLLFPSGDFADELEQLTRLCDATSSSDCGKIVFRPSESIGLRADVLFQGYVVNVFTVETDSPNAEISRNIRGTRFFVMAGVEL